MQTNPIQQRELGATLSPRAFSQVLQSPIWHLTVNPNQNSLQNSSSQRSEIVWIRGQFNYFVSLETHGRAFLHTTFPENRSLSLSKPSEKVQKVALGTSFLLLIIKISTSEFLQFFRVLNETLQTFLPVRKQVLTGLQVKSAEIQEIDVETSRVVVSKNGKLQIWSLDDEQLVIEVPIGVYSKYSRGFVIMAYQISDSLCILIRNLADGAKFRFNLPNGCVLYHCEVVGTSLVLGLTGREMQIIDFCTGEIVVIGRCKRYYEMEQTDDAFVMLDGGNGVFVSQPRRKLECGRIGRIFANNGNRLFVYSKAISSVVVLDPIDCVRFVRVERSFKVNTIGVNSDSRTLYIGSTKGTISVFD